MLGGDGGRSGVPRYLSQLCHALSGSARLGLVSDRNRGGYDFAAAAGVPLHEVPGLASGLDPRPRAAALRAMARIIDTQGPDLVWAHARMAVIVLRGLAVWRRITGRAMPRVAVTFHGLPFGPGHHPAIGWASLRLERLFCRLMPSHHLLFLSEDACQSYGARMPARAFARHHCHVLTNCSDLDPLPPRPRAPGTGHRLVMFGRDGRQKNLVAAAPILAALPTGTHLTICGIGSDSPAIRAAFADRQAQVTFAGETGDVRPLLATADLLLMTSRYEGMPIAALEAFEAGLPLALPRIAGTRHIRAHHPLVAEIDPDDPQEAAARICAVLETYASDPEGWNGTLRTAWAAQFSFAVWSEALRRIVPGLLA